MRFSRLISSKVLFSCFALAIFLYTFHIYSKPQSVSNLETNTRLHEQKRYESTLMPWQQRIKKFRTRTKSENDLLRLNQISASPIKYNTSRKTKEIMNLPLVHQPQGANNRVAPKMKPEDTRSEVPIPNQNKSKDTPRNFRIGNNRRVPPVNIIASQTGMKVTKNVTTSGANIAFDFSFCSSAKIMPRRSMPYTALASVPGSGNTWVRYLIERATGVYTGSVFRDPFLYWGGFKGERQIPSRRTVIAVKTHYDDTSHIRQYDKAIILVRNPYEAAISEAHRNNSDGNHTYVLPQSYFKSEKWELFASSHCYYWRSFVQNWSTHSKKHLVVFYENLLSNLHLELGRIVNFLQETPNATRIACTEQHSEGKFHRPPHKLNFDPFTKEMKIDCDQNIQELRYIIHKSDGYLLPPYEKMR